MQPSRHTDSQIYTEMGITVTDKRSIFSLIISFLHVVLGLESRVI